MLEVPLQELQSSAVFIAGSGRVAGVSSWCRLHGGREHARFTYYDATAAGFRYRGSSEPCLSLCTSAKCMQPRATFCGLIFLQIFSYIIHNSQLLTQRVRVSPSHTSPPRTVPISGPTMIRTVFDLLGISWASPREPH